MRHRAAVLAVLVLLAGGALVGCGGGDAPSPAAGTSAAALDSTSNTSTTTSLRAAGPPLEASTALAQVAPPSSGAPPTASVSAEVDLATWALRVCGATALVDAAAVEVFSDGLEGSSLTLEARIERELRITSRVADAARSAASAVAAVDSPPGGGPYQARVTVVLEDLARLLDEARGRISVAQTDVDVAEAYATLATSIGPELASIRADAQALTPTLAGALRATSRCAAFSGFASP